MHRTRFSLWGAAVLAAGLLAGCGSSTKTTGGSASKPPSSSTASASQSSSGAANPYGYSSGGSSSGSSSGQSVALITTKKHTGLGTILAYGPKKLTVYVFGGDKGGKSSCNGPCAAAWPPVTGTPKAGAGAMSADLGTITRSDGKKQVTYKGHPLYLFIRDKDGGDAYGEAAHAFGASWYALSPSGTKVAKS
jgi:predicted lipoprotein with Yx(FWY)xxD motif